MPRKNEAIWIESRQRWQINVQDDGERKTFTNSTPGTKGKIAAEKAADKWIENHQGKDVRFERLWSLYLTDIKDRTSAENYRKNETIARIWITPTIGKKKVSSITSADLQACINRAYKKGKSYRTCVNIRACISSAYTFARKSRYPMEAPFGLEIPRSAPKGEKNILQPDDLKRLFSVSTITLYGREKECHYISAWRFIVLTGMRSGEACGLQWRDIKDYICSINRAVNAGREITAGKTSSAKRYIVLTTRMLSVLDQQREYLKKIGVVSKWVFPDACGGMSDPCMIYNQWKSYRRQHEIISSVHEMRHTMISIAKADVPEQLLKLMVGHTKSMDTFGVYGHEVEGEMLRASQLLGQAFDKILE